MLFFLGKKRFYSGKVDIIGQSGCVWAKGVLFGQRCSNWAKLVLFMQNGCILVKVVEIGQKLLYSCKSSSIQAKWLY